MIDLPIPLDYRENLAYRRALNEWAIAKPAHRLAIRKKCREDVLWYVNSYVFQFNPQKRAPESPVGPFLTWPVQEKVVRTILECIERRRDMVVEKSREMGATWLFLIVADWLCRFYKMQQVLMMSRSADAVEHESPNSLFWKIDFIHRYLPPWLRGNIKRRKMYIGYEDSESWITGEASTGRAGVGGRATLMFIDEFSQIKEDYEVFHRTSDTAGTRFFNGTHCGTGTCFAELCDPRSTAGSYITKEQLHWTQHPEKRRGLYRFEPKTNSVEVLDKTHHFRPNFDFVLQPSPTGGPFPGLRSPWYDEQCLRKGSARAVAMDLDIDPQGSVSQFFNAASIRLLQASYACDPYWEGDVAYDRDTGHPLGLVKRAGGPLKLWVIPEDESKMPVGRYGAGADLSAGLGATNSCLSIVSADSGEKVAEYCTPFLPPEAITPLYLAVCWLFKDQYKNPALFGWEHAGPGINFSKCVLEMGYPRIYWRESGVVRLGFELSKVPGWTSTNDSKRLILEEYATALQRRQFINRSKLSLEECLDYRWTPDGRVEHPNDSGNTDPTKARTNHGDRVIADALAWKMVVKIGLGKAPERRQERAPVGSLAWRRLLAHDTERAEV